MGNVYQRTRLEVTFHSSIIWQLPYIVMYCLFSLLCLECNTMAYNVESCINVFASYDSDVAF